MGDDDLKAELKRWGHATVSRFALQHDGPSAGDSVLAKQRDLGLKSKLKRDDERELVKRDGSARRSTMAAAAPPQSASDWEMKGTSRMESGATPRCSGLPCAWSKGAGWA